MPSTRRFTLCKEERICSKLLIDKLFNGGIAILWLLFHCGQYM